MDGRRIHRKSTPLNRLTDEAIDELLALSRAQLTTGGPGGNGGLIGALLDLRTSDKTTIVAAINSLADGEVDVPTRAAAELEPARARAFTINVTQDEIYGGYRSYKKYPDGTLRGLTTTD